MGVGLAVGASVGSSLLSSYGQATAANKQAKAQSKAAMAYNNQVMEQARQGINQINVQRATNRSALQETRFNIGLEAQSKRSSVNVNAAASDTIGASVQDAIKTVDVGQSISNGNVNQQFMDAVEASNFQVRQLTDQSRYNLQKGTKPQGREIMKSGIFQAIGAGVGAYASGSSLGKATAVPDSPRPLANHNGSWYDRFGFYNQNVFG